MTPDHNTTFCTGANQSMCGNCCHYEPSLSAVELGWCPVFGKKVGASHGHQCTAHKTQPEPLPQAQCSAGRVCMCCKDLVPPDYPYAVCPRCDMQNAMDAEDPDNDSDACECCGGDGVVEYIDHPEVWGEDCPSEMNHLVPCPECNQRRPNTQAEARREGDV